MIEPSESAVSSIIADSRTGQTAGIPSEARSVPEARLRCSESTLPCSRLESVGVDLAATVDARDVKDGIVDCEVALLSAAWGRMPALVLMLADLARREAYSSR